MTCNSNLDIDYYFIIIILRAIRNLSFMVEDIFECKKKAGWVFSL